MAINYTTDDRCTITVHDGVFHADDVAAAALWYLYCKRVYSNDITIIRTREPEKFRGVVVDVGELKYDHHGSRYELDPDGVPYSGCSRLWEDIGGLLAGNEEVQKRFKKEVLDPISKIDNGLHLEPTEKHILNWVPAFVPGYESSRNMDDDFLYAETNAAAIFYHKLKSIQERVKAEAEMNYRIYTYGDNDVAVIKPGMDTLLYMLTPYTPKFAVLEVKEAGKKKYYVLTIPSDENDPFSKKMPLPEEWAGLRDEELADVSGFPSAIFCHKARFIAGFGTFEDAMAAARYAVAQAT